jgi:putative redox protein
VAVRIEIEYPGELRCRSTHAASSTTLATDAPVDNQGKGASFSPTDLAATALGTCMATTMGIVARRKGWNIDGIGLSVEKHMTAAPPRRVARLDVAFRVPAAVSAALDAEAKAELERVAQTCPVALSLHPDVKLDVSFGW